MTSFPPNLEHDLLRALQLSYYVDSISLVEDPHFDAMERAWELTSGRELPVGSDSLKDYTPAERALALYLQFALGKRRPS